MPALSLRGTSAPVVAGSAVVAGFDNGLLVALALKDGQLFLSLMADGAIAYRPVVGCWEVTRAVSDIAA